MSVEVEYDTIRASGSCLSFYPEWRGDGVEVEVEYPDLGAWSGGRTATMTMTLAREDWEAIVAFLERAKTEVDPVRFVRGPRISTTRKPEGDR